MKNYLELMKKIINEGRDNPKDRTGHGRRRLFSQQVRFDLSDMRLPVVTTRAINPMLGIYEMLFFINGKTNVSWLHQYGCKIWDMWAVKPGSAIDVAKKMEERGIVTAEEAMFLASSFGPETIGEIGPMYGYIWRHAPLHSDEMTRAAITRTVAQLPSDFLGRINAYLDGGEFKDKTLEEKEEFILMNYHSHVDQLNELVWNLKTDPYSSRHLVSAFMPSLAPIAGYSPEENVLLGRCSLMPCHHSFEVFVQPSQEPGGKDELSLQANFRSWDVPIGGPTNIAGYGFLAHLLAHCSSMVAKELSIVAGDAHVYLDQIELAKEQIQREPLESPRIKFSENLVDLFACTPADVTIGDFSQHSPIKYPVAK